MRHSLAKNISIYELLATMIHGIQPKTEMLINTQPLPRQYNNNTLSYLTSSFYSFGVLAPHCIYTRRRLQTGGQKLVNKYTFSLRTSHLYCFVEYGLS